MMRLVLPFPPSTNTAYATVRGRRVKTKRAREYAEHVQFLCSVNAWCDTWIIKTQELDVMPRLAVTIEVHPPDRRRRDLANMEKLCVDAVFSYLGMDDSLIDDLHLTRHELDKPHGKLVMTIREADRG